MIELQEIFEVMFTASDGTPIEDVCVDRSIEEAFDAEVPEVQDAIADLQERIEALQESMWGEGTPEGRELFGIERMLLAQDAELVALQDSMDEAQTLEEYERAVIKAQERMEEIKAQVLRSAERVSQLSGA